MKTWGCPTRFLFFRDDFAVHQNDFTLKTVESFPGNQLNGWGVLGFARNQAGTVRMRGSIRGHSV